MLNWLAGEAIRKQKPNNGITITITIIITWN